MSAKTYIPKPKTLERKWMVIDANGKAPGRLAAQIAKLLLGKDKVTFTPHLDQGTSVIVVNAAKVAATGRKFDQKIYTTYSGYPSGLKRMVLKDLLEKHPERVIIRAVKGMLPHNRLGRKLMTRLRVFTGPEHTHQAQVNTKTKKDKK